MSAALASHIRVDDSGIAWIDGTNIKVLEVVLDKLTYGWSPEEISFQHYETLSLGQIHAAFSYYYDHQAELDADSGDLLTDRDCGSGALAALEGIFRPVGERTGGQGEGQRFEGEDARVAAHGAQGDLRSRRRGYD